MTKKLKNPFPVIGYHGPEYFCDREKELKRLLINIESGSSTTLISIRRIGKTGLIQHLFHNLPPGWKGIYVDILATENLSDLLNIISTAVLRTIPEKTTAGKKFWNLIKSLRPVITFNSLTNEPQLTFDIKPAIVQTSVSQILNFLENQDFNTVIALDEFQQVMNYPEKNADTWLRSIIQQMKKVVFIFSGSQQHIMTELFVSPSRPFFRSTQIMTLDKIDKEIYRNFIISKFSERNKEISADVVNEILDWCNVHTYYVQLLCNRIFSAAPKTVSPELWKLQAEELISEQEQVFYNYRNLLTPFQWQLLKAIAQEEKVYSPTGNDFINKYELGSSAAVLRGLNALMKYELIYRSTYNQGKSYYSVYDVIFGQWVKIRGKQK